ncbi:response regulator [Fischerella sp. PCC 9605]|uniref:response regulator n=1 Tax=Fischerella sp. PCC 9605 TaxID=1173024 RepID=UPI000478C8E5|nr:response regulator [Fischerella sp. PCC 9605]
MTNTILLVEDNPTDILLIQRVFRNEALTHTSLQIVKDGEAAIFYLSGKGEYADRICYPLPSIILLDLKLPRRSGHEVLAWIKQQPELKRVPVIVLTSSRQKEDVNQAYDLGANSYLVKPVKFTVLSEMLNSFSSYWLEFNEPPEL